MLRRGGAIAAALGLAAAAAGAAADGAQRPLAVDLASGRVGGRVVLGRSPDEALAALAAAGLGAPDARVRLAAGYTAYRFGAAGAWRALLLVRPVGGRVEATSVAVADAAVAAPAVGPLLVGSPLAVRRRVAARVPSLAPAKCAPPCPGQWLSADGARTVVIGSTAGRRFVRIELANARAG